MDRIEQILPETVPLEKPKVDDGDASPEIARSVSLAADDLGLMGKLDLVSCDLEGGQAIPVETKRGRVPAVPLRSYPPERVQVMAQGLLLRRHGYQSDHSYLYFAGSRTRVRVDFDEELEQQTLAIIAAVREGRAATVMPPPLEDSPKCWGCSLCGICLPDETHELRRDHEAEEMPVDLGSDPRRLYPARAIGGPRWPWILWSHSDRFSRTAWSSPPSTPAWSSRAISSPIPTAAPCNRQRRKPYCGLGSNGSISSTPIPSSATVARGALFSASKPACSSDCSGAISPTCHGPSYDNQQPSGLPLHL